MTCEYAGVAAEQRVRLLEVAAVDLLGDEHRRPACSTREDLGGDVRLVAVEHHVEPAVLERHQVVVLGADDYGDAQPPANAARSSLEAWSSRR